MSRSTARVKPHRRVVLPAAVAAVGVALSASFIIGGGAAQAAGGKKPPKPSLTATATVTTSSPTPPPLPSPTAALTLDCWRDGVDIHVVYVSGTDYTGSEMWGRGELLAVFAAGSYDGRSASVQFDAGLLPSSPSVLELVSAGTTVATCVVNPPVNP